MGTENKAANKVTEVKGKIKKEAGRATVPGSCTREKGKANLYRCWHHSRHHYHRNRRAATAALITLSPAACTRWSRPKLPRQCRAGCWLGDGQIRGTS